jgi:hypothetical protein
MTVDKLLDKVQARTATEDEIELAVNILHYCGSIDERALPLVGIRYNEDGKILSDNDKSEDFYLIHQINSGRISYVKYYSGFS